MTDVEAVARAIRERMKLDAYNDFDLAHAAIAAMQSSQASRIAELEAEVRRLEDVIETMEIEPNGRVD